MRAAPGWRRPILLGEPALDLELHDASFELVDLLRHRVDLDAERGGRLVDQVDRLVRQEAIGDVAIRQTRRPTTRASVLDADAVVHLVALLEAAQNRDRVARRSARSTTTGWNRRSSAASFSTCLRYSSRVVAPMQSELSPSERRLEHVGGVDRALGRAGTDDRVQLVDEQRISPAARLDLLQDRLEALLELATVLRARHHRAAGPARDALVLQPVRDVAADDALAPAPRRSPSCRRRARR